MQAGLGWLSRARSQVAVRSGRDKPERCPPSSTSITSSMAKRQLVEPRAELAADEPLGDHRALCFLTSQELCQAASVSRAVRLSVRQAIAAWRKDLSGGAARVPLPCTADPGGGHGMYVYACGCWRDRRSCVRGRSCRRSLHPRHHTPSPTVTHHNRALPVIRVHRGSGWAGAHPRAEGGRQDRRVPLHWRCVRAHLRLRSA